MKFFGFVNSRKIIFIHGFLNERWTNILVIMGGCHHNSQKYAMKTFYSKMEKKVEQSWWHWKKSSVVMSIYVAILFTSLRCWISNYNSSLKPSIITNTFWVLKRFFELWLNMVQLSLKFMSVKWWCRIRGAIQVEKHSMTYFSVIRSWHKFKFSWENHFFYLNPSAFL